MARMPDREDAVSIKGQGNKEAAGHMAGSYGNASNAMSFLPAVGVFLLEAILSLVSFVTGAIAVVVGGVAAVVGAIAGALTKISGMCSDLKDEIKASFVNWKAKNDRIAAQAKKLEAMEA